MRNFKVNFFSKINFSATDNVIIADRKMEKEWNNKNNNDGKIVDLIIIELYYLLNIKSTIKKNNLIVNQRIFDYVN
jgi:hypothetical protein